MPPGPSKRARRAAVFGEIERAASRETLPCHVWRWTPYEGKHVDEAEHKHFRDTLEEMAMRLVPCEGWETPVAVRVLSRYLAWRFAAGSMEEVAAALGADVAEVERDCEQVRLRRLHAGCRWKEGV